MKKIFNLVTALILMGSVTPLVAEVEESETETFIESSFKIPTISNHPNWETVPHVAQYWGADWSHVIGRAYDVSLQDAYIIAENNPEVTFFFYVYAPVLNLGEGKVFRSRDAVFFAGEPSWGNAGGYAHGYVKKNK